MNQEKNDRQNKRHLIIFSVFFIAILVIITLLTRYSKNPEELGAENSNNEKVVFQEEEGVNDVGEGKEEEEEPQESYQYPAILTSEDLEDIDTSDWLTYENETHGFSLRYPSSWSLAGENTSLTSYSFQGFSSFGIDSPDFVVNNKGAQVGVGLLRLSLEYQDKDPLEYLSTIGCVKTLYEVRGYDYIVETDQNSHDIMRYWYTNVVLTEIVDGWKWTGMESVDGKLYKNPGDTFQAFRYITSCYEIHPDYINPNDLVKDRIALMINIDMTINDPSYYPTAMKIVDSFNYLNKNREEIYTNEWMTYTDQEGIEIKYPNNRDRFENYIISINEEKLFESLANVYINEYGGEYHNGNLYSVKRVGYDGYTDDDWSDELWKFSIKNGKEKIFSNKGLNFRVSPNEKYIAIIIFEEEKDKLLFINQNSETIKKFSIEKITNSEDYGRLGISLMEWSEDNKNFWGKIFYGPTTKTIFKISMSDLSLDSHEIYHLYGQEYSLNTTNEKLVYSDLPRFFDTDSVEEFNQSKDIVTLYIYDFKTRTRTIIDTLVAKSFHPVWLDNLHIEYNGSEIDNRLIYDINIKSY